MSLPVRPSGFFVTVNVHTGWKKSWFRQRNLTLRSCSRRETWKRPSESAPRRRRATKRRSWPTIEPRSPIAASRCRNLAMQRMPSSCSSASSLDRCTRQQWPVCPVSAPIHLLWSFAHRCSIEETSGELRNMLDTMAAEATGFKEAVHGRKGPHTMVRRHLCQICLSDCGVLAGDRHG